MFCTKCGREVLASAKFCANCGSPTVASADSPASASSPTPLATTASAPAPRPNIWPKVLRAVEVAAFLWVLVIVLAALFQPDAAYERWVAKNHVPACERAVATKRPDASASAGAAFCRCMIVGVRPSIGSLDMGITVASFGMINLIDSKISGTKEMGEACAAKAF